ncbi:hypothetical protein ACOYR1_05115 [Thalassotalea piscium]
MNFLLWKTCFKKEYWEYNKLLFWLPVVMLMIIVILPIVTFIFKDAPSTPWLETFAHFANISASPELPKAFTALTMGIFIPFIAIAGVIQLYYFLACLYDEKKDLSIYFWRSLPVADSTTVITKLLTGTFLIPGIFMLAATATLGVFLLMGFILTVILSIGFDISFWGAWVNADIISTVAMAWLNLIPTSLWLLPLFTWLMLTSMFAKKAPFLWAVLPILLLLLIEMLLVRYGFLPDFYVGKALKEYFAISKELASQNMRNVQQLSSIISNVLFSKINLFGIMLAAVFLYCTYWLRANKSHS